MSITCIYSNCPHSAFAHLTNMPIIYYVSDNKTNCNIQGENMYNPSLHNYAIIIVTILATQQKEHHYLHIHKEI